MDQSIVADDIRDFFSSRTATYWLHMENVMLWCLSVVEQDDNFSAEYALQVTILPALEMCSSRYIILQLGAFGLRKLFRASGCFQQRIIFTNVPFFELHRLVHIYRSLTKCAIPGSTFAGYVETLWRWCTETVQHHVRVEIDGLTCRSVKEEGSSMSSH